MFQEHLNGYRPGAGDEHSICPQPQTPAYLPLCGTTRWGLVTQPDGSSRGDRRPDLSVGDRARTRLLAPQPPAYLPSAAGATSSQQHAPMLAGLRGLSQQQRAMIALSLYGDHTYSQIADVMALPAPVVADLLGSGLHGSRTPAGRRAR